MTRDEWYEQIEAQFFDIITSRGSLDDLTDCAYSFLHNPLFIVNERGEIFSKAKDNPPYNDDLWEEFDQKGYVPREKQSYISAVQYASRMENDKVIIFEPAYISHRLMLFQTNLSPRFVLRVLMLESKRPFSGEDEHIFRLFAKTAGYFMRNSQMMRNFNSSTFEFFLHELISGHIDSEKNGEEIASYLGLKKGDRMVLLVAKSGYVGLMPISLYEARLGLQSIFPRSVAFIYEEHIVLFINQREQGGDLDRHMRLAESFLRQNSLHAGVSRYFECFRHIADHYRTTAKILEVGIFTNNKGALYYVSDLFVTHLLRVLPDDKRESFLFLPILELLESDKRNDTEYLPTLYAYVITMGSNTMAARLLGIHYNTMKYRLTHIKEVLDQNLAELLPTLYISLKILFLTRKDYMGKCFDMELQYRRLGEKRGEK